MLLAEMRNNGTSAKQFADLDLGLKANLLLPWSFITCPGCRRCRASSETRHRGICERRRFNYGAEIVLALLLHSQQKSQIDTGVGIQLRRQRHCSRRHAAVESAAV
jgi:hypothetical protein